MNTIHVDASRPYDVCVGAGTLENSGAFLRALSPAGKVMVVSDETVFKLYGEKLLPSLARAGFAAHAFFFTPGEKSKRLGTVEKLLEILCDKHFTRNDLIVTLGGGVVGDIGGFAAAVYARGMDYVQVPTTLLAAVDASVGGKTGVNLAHGKNLCGAFHQPLGVLCDPNVFATLSKAQMADGYSEMLKYGVLRSEKLFDAVRTHGDLAETVSECIRIKAEYVAADERDTGVRRQLNFGHTVGHAVEAASAFSVSHGSAVAIGMAILTRYAEAVGIAESGTAAKLTEALKACGLPTETAYSPLELAFFALADKKSDGEFVHLVLPRKIGECLIVPTPCQKLKDVIAKGM